MFQKNICTSFDKTYYSSRYLFFLLSSNSFPFSFFSKGLVIKAFLMMGYITTSVSHGATTTEIIKSGWMEK